MKQLSIEQKAKAYDEAIKRAKDFMNGEAHYELKIGENIMCWIFPELRESEDEMIRKELLNAFKEATDSLYMVLTPSKREEFIDWLEKQGKQKPAEWSEEDKNALKVVTDVFEQYGVHLSNYPAFMHWLKTLPERISFNTYWKPSDEQMKALSIVTHGVYDPLFSLYQDLKKLREEDV